MNKDRNLESFKNSLNVLITAGASGIGRAIAETFIGTGSSVYICDISETAVEDFRAAFPQAHARVTDISNPDQVEALFADIESRIGHIDVLVNNAGIAGPTAALENIDLEEWQNTVDVNLNGSFYVSRFAVPHLLKSRNPSIINIASSAVFSGYPNRSPYSATKWAILGLSKTWAMELGPKGVRVNVICPGSVTGPRIDAVIKRDAAERNMKEDELRDVYLRQTSLRKFVDSDDIAHSVLFLSSEFGRMISGQIIGVDGHTESLSNWLD